MRRTNEEAPALNGSIGRVGVSCQSRRSFAVEGIGPTTSPIQPGASSFVRIARLFSRNTVLSVVEWCVAKLEFATEHDRAWVRWPAEVVAVSLMMIGAFIVLSLLVFPAGSFPEDLSEDDARFCSR